MLNGLSGSERSAQKVGSREGFLCKVEPEYEGKRFIRRTVTTTEEEDKIIIVHAQPKTFNDGLFRSIAILNGIRLSEGDEEREAWPAIREAIKGIEAEIV